MVRKRYSASIRQEVLGEVVEKTFYQAVTEHQLRPVGQPNIENVVMEEGKDLSYDAVIEVFPEIELADLSSVDIEQAESTVEAKDVDQMIENLREQKKEWRESTRAQLKMVTGSPSTSPDR